MGCFTGTVKNVLFLFNFLIAVCGVTVIAIGGVILAKESQGIDSLLGFSIGGLSIAVGIIIFCTAFFGCCGNIKENNRMLTTYAVILIVLLILQIFLGSLALWGLKNTDDFEDEAKKVVRDIFEKYWAPDTNEEKKEVVHHVQQYFECCGITDSTFWPTPPPSCYKNSNIKGTLYKKGCAQAFQDAIVCNMRAIAIVVIVFAVIEIFGAVVAFIVRSRK